MPVTFRRVQLAGLTLHAATMHDALTLADQAIRQRRRLAFGMVNIAKLVNAGRDPLLQDSLLKSDVVLADGQPVVWLSRIQGEPLPERVAGIDLMYRLLELANQRGHAVFLLGATEAVNAAVAARIQQCYPACRLAGRRDGYFSEAEEAEVARQIRDSGADILFVAMSPPRKELFLRRWSDEMGIPVCHGVGGSFDVFAGLTRRAPLWMQRAGLEWLYRIWQEPRRMWKRYLVTNTKAIPLLFAALIARCRRLPAAHPPAQ
ncbi:MAG TPA: WecB/TagA/CpsF family glycosyltransferase [Phycisphaerae bacterium]|jgi:N-acetylglucosaminyldiphosphoundecaprenol N-acetyl-beta-D-mannosaminyltransferase|nr:WecB/TagA/CpsF family glycosyltransferase [Phycisphaerae bacterium]HPC22379.1 WecB/TagA/CpsF family glycosyltransferase [Phycisphaerae bacterium]HRS28122.1 WecB/TagA/CpsF family glycosyltransferase [Phycisphaerae bacterium]